MEGLVQDSDAMRCDAMLWLRPLGFRWINLGIFTGKEKEGEAMSFLIKRQWEGE